MGSEESKVKHSSINEQERLQRALEHQRRMYEDRYAELIDNQIRLNTANSLENQTNRNNVPNATTTNVLYPSLSTVTSHNRLVTAVDNTPDISNLHNISPDRQRTSIHAASTLPTAPPAPLNVNNNRGVSQCGTIPQQLHAPVNINTAPTAPLRVNNNRGVSQCGAIPQQLHAPVNINNNQGVSHNGAIPKQRPPPKVNKSIGVMCVTCKSDFGAQIYQCSDGHSSCNSCRFLSKRCGICSKLITDMRNITLEGTIADMKLNTVPNERIKCRNEKDGCSLSFTKDKIESHLIECPFNDIKCPLNEIQQNCSWTGKVNQIVNHFKDVHPQQCVADVDTEMNLNINNNKRIMYLVNIGSFNFVIYIEIKLSTKMMYMVAQLIGTTCSASKWTYELHIYNKREPKRKFQYEDTCHSNTMSVQDIFNKSHCAALSIDYAKTFACNSSLTYKFFLKRNTPPRRR